MVEPQNGLNINDQAIINKIGMARIKRIFAGLYTRLCDPCKAIVRADPKTAIDKYCPGCQAEIKKTLENLQ